jgi:hypothetical protein
MKRKLVSALQIAFAFAVFDVHSAYRDHKGKAQEEAENEEKAADGNRESHVFFLHKCYIYGGFGVCSGVCRMANTYKHGLYYADNAAMSPAAIDVSTDEVNGSYPGFSFSAFWGAGVRIGDCAVIKVEVGANCGNHIEAVQTGYCDMAGRLADIRLMRSGLVPWIALKAGGVSKQHRFHSYIILGVASLRQKERYVEYGALGVPNTGKVVTTSENRLCTMVPIIGIGIDKLVAHGGSVGVEVVCHTGKDKTKDFGNHGSTTLRAKDSFTVTVFYSHSIGLGRSRWL